MKKYKDLAKHEKVSVFLFIVIIIALVVLGIISKMNKQPDWLVYKDSLDKVCVTVDGNGITLRDTAFYIAYDESVVEDQAYMYDPEDTERYWNVCTNDVFLRLLAKEATMNKIIHDEIFYQMALKENITLNVEDMEQVEESKTVFWNSIMYDEKLERIGVTKEEIDAIIEKVALVQKYQNIYATNKSLIMDVYDIGNPLYDELLSEHEVKINSSVWDRVQYGEITLIHKTGVYN